MKSMPGKVDQEKKYRNNRAVKVSIVIPCYNQGEFVNEAIQSSLESDYKDYEIIVVNDGSTDVITPKKIRELEKDFRYNNRIRFIHQNNMGLAMARNNAIKEAVGEYILPLDADNRITPNYLSRAVYVLENNPDVGVVYAYANLFGEKNRNTGIPDI